MIYMIIIKLNIAGLDLSRPRDSSTKVSFQSECLDHRLPSLVNVIYVFPARF